MRITSSQRIYEEIREDILYLRRKPGEELNIQLLSEELSVSRSPVRDAFMLLQNEALVNVYPQRGCWVSLIDLEKVSTERLLRLSLERCVLEHLDGKLRQSDIAGIEYFIALQKEALEKNDRKGFYSSDDDMHHVYFKAAGLDSFWHLWVRETANYRRVRLLSFDAKGIAETNIKQHEEILDAFKKKDFVKALEIMNEHVMKLNYEKDAIIKQHPDYFTEGKNETIK